MKQSSKEKGYVDLGSMLFAGALAIGFLGGGMEWSFWSIFFVLVAYGLFFAGLIFVANHWKRR